MSANNSKDSLTIEKIKALGKERCDKNLTLLIELYSKNDVAVPIKREIVSSIGRQKNYDRVYCFLKENAFSEAYMDVVYQMFRTTLYRSDIPKFKALRDEMLSYYDNEIMKKMKWFYENKSSRPKKIRHSIITPSLLKGDSAQTLSKISDGEIQLIFTSPPYYNAKTYSSYKSYHEYLNKMSTILRECNRVLEDGRFIIINVSPVITKRPGREFESIRYPIHFDFHKILEDNDFSFIDEIIWIKPEGSAKNRVGGYYQTRKPLAYKPNCITESLLVYRKNVPFLLDKNIESHEITIDNEENLDSSNCWYISPKSSKKHPAIFPEELCRRVLKYYSFEGDVVMDPFAGSGTFGKVAKKMGRIPVLCEINEEYIKNLEEEEYDVL